MLDHPTEINEGMNQMCQVFYQSADRLPNQEEQHKLQEQQVQLKVVEALKGYDETLEILTAERDGKIESVIEESAALKFKKQ